MNADGRGGKAGARGIGLRLYFMAFVDRAGGRRITSSFDADVLAALQAGGPSWQTRVNDAMREWIKSHPEGR